MDKEVLSIILILILVLLFALMIYLNNSKKIDKSISKRILGDLTQVKKMVDTKNPLVYRDTIIRLDQLLSKSLQLHFRNTESCGNNLKNARDLFEKKAYNEIWEIHKLRNEIVHENQEVSSSQATRGYNIMSNAIKKLIYG